MPVSYLSFIIVFISLALICIGAVIRKSGYSRPLIKLGISLVVVPPILNILVAFVLWVGAVIGFRAWQYELARWLESTPDMMSPISVIPYDHPFEYSWYWLERAAAGGSKEAQFAIGCRIKHNMFVPGPVNRDVDAQRMMDQAVAAGFKLRVAEEQYYFGQYRISVPASPL